MTTASKHSERESVANTQLETLLDERAGARFYGIFVATVRRWRWLKTGPVYRKIGSSVRYKKADLEADLQTRPAGGGRVVFFRFSGDSKSVMTDGLLHSLSADIDAYGELHHQLKLHIAADREYAPREEGSVSPEARLPEWHPDRARHHESRARILNNIISNVSNNSVAPFCTSLKVNEETVPAGVSR